MAGYVVAPVNTLPYAEARDRSAGFHTRIGTLWYDEAGRRCAEPSKPLSLHRDQERRTARWAFERLDVQDTADRYPKFSSGSDVVYFNEERWTADRLALREEAADEDDEDDDYVAKAKFLCAADRDGVFDVEHRLAPGASAHPLGEGQALVITPPKLRYDARAQRGRYEPGVTWLGVLRPQGRSLRAGLPASEEPADVGARALYSQYLDRLYLSIAGANTLWMPARSLREVLDGATLSLPRHSHALGANPILSVEGVVQWAGMGRANVRCGDRVHQLYTGSSRLSTGEAVVLEHLLRDENGVSEWARVLREGEPPIPLRRPPEPGRIALTFEPWDPQKA